MSDMGLNPTGRTVDDALRAAALRAAGAGHDPIGDIRRAPLTREELDGTGVPEVVETSEGRVHITWPQGRYRYVRMTSNLLDGMVLSLNTARAGARRREAAERDVERLAGALRQLVGALNAAAPVCHHVDPDAIVRAKLVLDEVAR